MTETLRERVDENIANGLLDCVVDTHVVGAVWEIVSRNIVQRLSLGQVGFAWNDEEDLDRWDVILLGFKIVRNRSSSRLRKIEAAPAVCSNLHKSKRALKRFKAKSQKGGGQCAISKLPQQHVTKRKGYC